MCLSRFVGCCRISVRQCMLGGNKNILRGAGSGSSLCPHPVCFVKLRDQTVRISEILKSFINVVKKKYVLMIYICED